MPFAFALLVAALGGFIALSYEILWYRVYAFASGGVAATFPLLLGAYLAGLAGGALAARSVSRRYQHGPGTVQALAAFAVLVNVLGFLVIPALAWIVRVDAWTATLPLVALAAAMFGTLLPLLSHLAIPPDEQVGARLSYLYGANILGSTLGSLLTGYVLMQYWDTETIARFLVLSGLALAAVLALTSSRGTRAVAWGAGIAATMAATWFASPSLHDRLFERLLYKGRDDGSRFERLVENRHGVIAVTKAHHVFSGGIYDGMVRIDLDNDPNHLVRALALAALHPAPKRVLMIGLATGAWSQVIASLPSVEQLTVVDINPGFLELIGHYPEVRSLLTNPKVRVVIDDGRRWLARHPDEQFDAIVSNTTFNWRAYTSQLLSVEFMTMAREHLAPGGIVYANTTDAPNAYASAFSVFPHGARFLNFVAASDQPIAFNQDRWIEAMIGSRIDGVAPFDTSTTAGRARIGHMLAIARSPDGWNGDPALESRSAMLPKLREVLPITDDNMGTEWRAVHPPLYVP